METEDTDRLEVLTRKLAARTTGDGKPVKGYKRNVVMLKAEIARLTARGATP